MCSKENILFLHELVVYVTWKFLTLKYLAKRKTRLNINTETTNDVPSSYLSRIKPKDLFDANTYQEYRARPWYWKYPLGGLNHAELILDTNTNDIKTRYGYRGAGDTWVKRMDNASLTDK
jgi:hypothetical protein